ncbi:unnamed protein product [Ostreobium quekettii]|uniref:Uncharacterized protein n=1 Tax=Ostreobium quekettii TaxID=121088 RepID=A0A8S1JBV4_9CHLO|nr:unnamed protein product [Ostreobium quekettii]
MWPLPTWWHMPASFGWPAGLLRPGTKCAWWRPTVAIGRWLREGATRNAGCDPRVAHRAGRNYTMMVRGRIGFAVNGHMVCVLGTGSPNLKLVDHLEVLQDVFSSCGKGNGGVVRGGRGRPPLRNNG